jgi:hypothetical protein
MCLFLWIICLVATEAVSGDFGGIAHRLGEHCVAKATVAGIAIKPITQVIVAGSHETYRRISVFGRDSRVGPHAATDSVNYPAGGLAGNSLSYRHDYRVVITELFERFDTTHCCTTNTAKNCRVRQLLASFRANSI